ncbi:hypothetical protein [Rheinheimera sp. NSM]|uniref:hypothetical protein n=1 Tax=Rheinheimera sp. NSM TaxID=3457884 RepID=UPI004035A2F8
MRRLLLGLAVSLPAGFVSAADINCEGKVSRVMDYPPSCNGNTAFKTNDPNGRWICSPSDKGDALVLAALAADKIVDVYIDDQNGAFTCSTLVNYEKARYIMIRQ